MNKEQINQVDNIQKAMYEADIFSTGCKENSGMEDEYYHVSSGLVEENISSLDEFFESLDFWYFEGYTKSLDGSVELYEKVKAYL